MPKQALLQKIRTHTAKIGIIGLGYVGLPLVIRFGEESFNVTGLDIDNAKIDKLNTGCSYINHIPSEKTKKLILSKKFQAYSDFSYIKDIDCIIICVPTPLNGKKEPDMSFIEATSDEIAKYIHPGQLIVLESTTYPGTTREILLPKFEKKGLKAGKDFFLAFSPEREDPDKPKYNTQNIPKVVGGIPPDCTEVAEFTKLLENIYRSVNIALVNELKMLAERMNVNIREVIEAASTKPFGFTPFYPGFGLAGINRLVQAAKARARGYRTTKNLSTMICLSAGKFNLNLPT